MIIGMPPKLILMDADGVLWRGGSAVPAAPGFINRARQAGLRCLIVSNNAGPDREAYLARCQRLGIPVDKEDIFSVNHLAGPFVARHYDGAQVLVIGSEMLVTQMRRHVAVSSADELLAEMGIAGRAADPSDLRSVQSVNFDVVIIGIDVNVSYLKLCLACSAVQHGAELIGANPDYSFPVEDGIELPGNGSIVELVSRISGVEPEYLGKPSLHLLEQIEQETGVNRNEMIMVGDRIETDIEFARRANIPAYLVLTGVTAREDLSSEQNGYTVIETMEDLAAILGI